jgi:hypothetical protein
MPACTQSSGRDMHEIFGWDQNRGSILLHTHIHEPLSCYVASATEWAAPEKWSQPQISCSRRLYKRHGQLAITLNRRLGPISRAQRAQAVKHKALDLRLVNGLWRTSTSNLVPAANLLHAKRSTYLNACSANVCIGSAQNV